MKQLRAIDALNDRVRVVDADRHPAELLESESRGRTTHVAVLDEGRFCGLVGIKQLMECPPGWIFGDLASKGSVLRIAAQAPLDEVCLALVRECQDAAAVIDDVGTYVGSVTLEDISRRLAEVRATAATISRNSLLAALESSVIVAVTDLSGTITEANEAFCRISGYGREELIGSNHRIVNSGHHSKEFWVEMWKIIAKGDLWRAEVCNKAKDGSLYWVDTTIGPVRDETGQTCGYIAVRMDISERKRAERRLAESEERTRLVIDTALDAVVAMDQEGRITRWNAQAERIFGWSAAEAVGRPLDELIIPEGLRGAHRAGLARYAAGGEARVINKRIEVPALRKDGAEITVELAITAVRSGSGGSAKVWFSAFLRDITEQKRAESRLRESEHRLERVLTNIHDAVIVDDVDGHLVYANPRFFRLFGIPEQDPRSIVLEDYVPPDWRERLRDRHDRRVRGEPVPDQFEYEGMRADGTRVWLEVSVVPVVENGRITGTLSAIRDVTERKRAEIAAEKSAAAVLASKRQLREMIDGCFGFIGLYDLEGTLIEVNLAPLDAGGISRDEVIGRPFWETYWWSFSSEVQATLRDALRRAAAGETVRYETPVRVKGDGRITVDVTFGPLCDPDGRVTGIIGFGVDITERKRAERTLRESEARLLEAQRIAQIGSWDLDIPSGELVWSDTVFEIFEIDRRKFGATYEGFLGAVHPDDRDTVNTAYTQSVRNRTPYNIVHRLLMPDGRVKHLHERCETFYDDQGHPVRSLGTAQDISERTRIEAELAEAAKREALATLAGGIAHEFNSVLLAAATYLHGAPSGAAGLDASIAKAAALVQQAQSLSASLLELFAGPEQIMSPILPLGTWLPECVRQLADVLPSGVRVKLDPFSGLSEARADPLALEQVLRILLTNAADALAGQGEVHVSTAPVGESAGDGQGVEIRVSDQGPGIPESDRDRVFEPFFTTRNRSRRSGLGLAIASRLVEQAGGSLSFEPNKPRGSTFVIRLRSAHRGAAG